MWLLYILCREKNIRREKGTGLLGRIKKECAFTYLGALVLLFVSGIALAGANQYWSVVLKREKEKELLFRGDQIRSAIQAFYGSAPGGQMKRYPANLDELMKDPRYLDTRRYLRKRYRDPMISGGEWGRLMDERGGMKGVFSLSSRRPMKVGGFPEEYQAFNNAQKYSDWRFVCVPQSQKTAQKE
jgi:hypothetical protein